MKLLAYTDEFGLSPFQKWFDRLDGLAASRVNTALVSLQYGALGKAKSVGGGVHELRISHGPGYRVYFANDGLEIVILLGGGTKKRQSRDIADAKTRWLEYKRLKGK